MGRSPGAKKSPRNPRRIRRPHLPRWLSGKQAQIHADALSDLILARVNEPAEAREFVKVRYRDRLATHIRMAPRHALLFSSLSVISISSGVAASTLAAAGKANSAWVFALGLLVAGSTALNQIGKFGQRSAVRFRAANALRQEGWDFAIGRGRYEGLSYEAGEAFGAFYDAVWQIERPADALAEGEPEASEHNRQ
jgi:hypothetical protein